MYSPYKLILINLLCHVTIPDWLILISTSRANKTFVGLLLLASLVLSDQLSFHWCSLFSQSIREKLNKHPGAWVYLYL